MSYLVVNIWPDAKETALGDMEQVLTIASLSTSSQATSGVTENSTSKIKRARVYANADIYLAFGTNPDATDSTQQIPVGADNPEYFTVPIGTKFDAITR